MSDMESVKKGRPDILGGSIPRTLLALAWPMILSMSFHTGFNVIDTIFVGMLGGVALTAISMTFPVVLFLIALSSGVSIGTTSLVARLMGAKDTDKASNAALQGLLLGFVMMLIIMVIGTAFSGNIFRSMGADEQVLPLVRSYMHIFFIGIGSMVITFIANGILRGTGDMLTPMKAMMLGTAINIVLDPILIFGVGPVPAMGIAGAAIATVIARTIGGSYAILHLLLGRADVVFHHLPVKWDFPIIKSILNVGIPTSLNHISMSLSLFIFVNLLSTYGNEPIAAFGVGNRLDLVAFLPIIGVSQAVITMVGQNTGARQFHRVRRATVIGAYIGALIMGSIGVVYFLLPQTMVSVFTQNASIIHFGSQYLRIMALSYAFLAVCMVYGGAFQGMGKAVPALIITLLRVALFSIPLALFLSLIMGWAVLGLFWGMTLANIMAAVISVLWFRTKMRSMVA